MKVKQVCYYLVFLLISWLETTISVLQPSIYCLSIKLQIFFVYNDEEEAQFIHFKTNTNRRKKVNAESKCHEPVLMSCYDENIVWPLNSQEAPQA